MIQSNSKDMVADTRDAVNSLHMKRKKIMQLQEVSIPHCILSFFDFFPYAQASPVGKICQLSLLRDGENDRARLSVKLLLMTLGGSFIRIVKRRST